MLDGAPEELASVESAITGGEVVLDEWPAAPAGRKGTGTGEVGGGYYIGGLGTVNDAGGQVLFSS